MIYVAGCDVSGGGADEFAWAVAHAEGERVVIDLIRARGRPLLGKFNPEQAVAACAADLAAYKITSVTGDRYAAQWPVEAFRKCGIIYRASERTKSELYLEMLPLVTAGRLELPPDAETVRQLKLLIRRTGSQGKDNIDHPVGAHDDRINAVGLCAAQLTQFALGDAPLFTGPTRERAAAAWTARAERETAPWDADDNFVLGVNRDW